VRRPLVQLVLPGHRWILIAGTTILAVATSFLVADASNFANWLLVIGGGLIMYVSDVCREVEGANRDLASASHRRTSDTRVDIFDAEAPRFTLLAFVIGCVAVAAGLFLH
jgi:hypothetical protein